MPSNIEVFEPSRFSIKRHVFSSIDEATLAASAIRSPRIYIDGVKFSIYELRQWQGAMNTQILDKELTIVIRSFYEGTLYEDTYNNLQDAVDNINKLPSEHVKSTIIKIGEVIVNKNELIRWSTFLQH